MIFVTCKYVSLSPTPRWPAKAADRSRVEKQYGGGKNKGKLLIYIFSTIIGNNFFFNFF